MLVGLLLLRDSGWGKKLQILERSFTFMGLATDRTDHFQSCIEACMKYSQARLECFDACVNWPNVKEIKNCIHVLDVPDGSRGNVH